MMIEVECQVESSCALSKLRLKGGWCWSWGWNGSYLDEVGRWHWVKKKRRGCARNVAVGKLRCVAAASAESHSWRKGDTSWKRMMEREQPWFYHLPLKSLIVSLLLTLWSARFIDMSVVYMSSNELLLIHNLIILPPCILGILSELWGWMAECKQAWGDYISWCTVGCGGQHWSNETTLPPCQLLQPSSLMSDVPSMRGWTVVASCQVMCWSHDILPYPRCIICTLYIVQYNNGAQYIRT